MKTILVIIAIIAFNVFVFLFMYGANKGNKKLKPPKNETTKIGQKIAQ